MGQPPPLPLFGGPPFHGVLLVSLVLGGVELFFMLASGDVFLSLLSF